MSVRDTINIGDANRLPAAFQAMGLGDFLAVQINAMAATESGLTPASNVVTLANVPSSLFDVNATAATTTGQKKLLKGPISGPLAVTPATGQCVWDGGKKILFAASDVVTAVSVKYATTATATPSVLQRDVGEQDR